MPTALQAQSHETSVGSVTVERIVGDLEFPWAVAFLPDGGYLITERPGSLLHVSEEGARRALAGVPEVDDGGQGGLLDIAISPDFSMENRIFFTYARPAGGGRSSTAVATARLDLGAGALRDVTDIFVQEPALRGGRHFGSRIAFAPDGELWVTFGDRGDRPEAQNTLNSIGAVIRIAADGTPSASNPGGDGVLPQLWSWGHRNVQGATTAPDGTLWTIEHGARGGDELNRPLSGLNYGWPEISYGRHYSGLRIGQGTEAPGYEQPIRYWDPSIAPSGLAFYSGDLFPEWQGDLFAGALRGQAIHRIDMEGEAPVGEEVLFEGAYGRIRDVRQGPDGALWFLTDAPDGGLYRVSPAQ
ncbi:MAG: PQQ-dependent sugar dehydrogenase [Rubricella sp.]